MPEEFDAIVIGAGPAGLAAAACLKKRGFEAGVLEKADAVGAVWRRHYDRLHLHTDRSHSGPPGLSMPSSYGRYPSRAQVVEYLEKLRGEIRSEASIQRPGREGPPQRRPLGRRGRRRDRRGSGRRRGDRLGRISLFAGLARHGDVGGPIAHSSRYRNPQPYAGQRVLVVGFGNSGGEIALDLAEAGVDATLSVRGPVNILPGDLFGLPILTFAIAERRLPARVADTLNAPAIRLAVACIERLGLTRATKGPRGMIEENGRIPLLDIGTVAMIRAGRIKVRGDVLRFASKAVVFAQSPPERFDAVILAAGFRPDLRPLLPDAKGVLSDAGKPLVSGAPSAEPGLFFCGAIASPTGQFREIGIEAARIAESVAANRSLRSLSPTRAAA